MRRRRLVLVDAHEVDRARAAGRCGRARRTCARASRSPGRARSRRARLPRRARGGASARRSRPRRRRRPASPTSLAGRRRGTARAASGRVGRARARARPWRSIGSSQARSARNQRSRSAYGTAAFAGDVDGRTKSRVVAERPHPAGRAPAARRTRRGTPPCRRRRARAGDSSRAIRSSRSRRAREVGAAQVARARRRAVRGVRDADPELEQLELLVRLVEPRREAGVVEQPPEVVARIREVRAGRRRDAARVDAAEDDVEARREDVRDVARRVGRCHELGTHGCDSSCESSFGGSRAP